MKKSWVELCWIEVNLILWNIEWWHSFWAVNSTKCYWKCTANPLVCCCSVVPVLEALLQLLIQHHETDQIAGTRSHNVILYASRCNMRQMSQSVLSKYPKLAIQSWATSVCNLVSSPSCHHIIVLSHHCSFLWKFQLPSIQVMQTNGALMLFRVPSYIPSLCHQFASPLNAFLDLKQHFIVACYFVQLD